MLRDINEKLLHSSNSIWKHGRMWQYVFIDMSIQTFQRVVMHTFVRPSSNGPQCSVARLTNPGPHYLKQALDTLESLPFLPSRMLAVDLSLAKVSYHEISTCRQYLLMEAWLGSPHRALCRWRERKETRGGRIFPGCSGGASSMRSGGRHSKRKSILWKVAEASQCREGARVKDVRAKMRWI